MSTVVDTVSFLHRVNDVLEKVGYRGGYQFAAAIDNDDSVTGRVYVELWHWREDADNPGVLAWGSGGKRFLSPTMTDSEIVRTCLGAALSYEEHEVREFFTYRGRRIYGPHLDVEALVEIADRVDFR